MLITLIIIIFFFIIEDLELLLNLLRELGLRMEPQGNQVCLNQIFTNKTFVFWGRDASCKDKKERGGKEGEDCKGVELMCVCKGGGGTNIHSLAPYIYPMELTLLSQVTLE